MLILDSLPVGRYSVDRNKAFVWREEFSGRGQIGEDEQRDDTPEHGYGAEDEEDIHPFRQACCDVAYGVAD